MNFFKNFFTAIAATLILSGVATANVNPTLIAKAPYVSSEIVRIADSCPEGTMGDEQVKETAAKVGLTVDKVVSVRAEDFPALLVVVSQLAPPPAGTTGFKVFFLTQNDEESVFFSAQDKNGCSLGGIRMSVDLLKSMLEAAMGRGS